MYGWPIFSSSPSIGHVDDQLIYWADATLVFLDEEVAKINLW